MTKRADVLAGLPVVFGLSELEAAASIGVSATKFREMVADKRMPPPRRIDARLVFDVEEVRLAFKQLPHAHEEEKDTWADVV
jgi:hypothetical protein